MNSIDTLIALANLRGSLDLRCQFQGDWAMDHAPEALGVAPYHIVLSGTCRAELSGGQQVTLEPGDILLMPGGATHLLRSQGARRAPSQPQVIDGGLLKVHRLGGNQPDIDMLCGSFHYNRQSLLFGALPEYLVVSSREWQGDGQLAALIALMRSEADGQQLGARTFIDALSSALFTLILRTWLNRQAPVAGTFALLADKRLSKAWQAMLAEPGHEWTIDNLAAVATMSRATFMRAFVKVAGVSPWLLLTQLRMELAYNLLRQSRLSLLDIAAQVGYQSQAAFSKKFKETYGEAPGRLRSNADHL
ncbi:AraC family transcriptional regulator [Pseudomonas sp. B6002]|uniref:AraC family transcriptional regulator n=1 Tax=Pseudomonas sp. B6002 TaxID=2726978 RepID=UPI00159F782C|nr:AraC family transcriptional regulator [Pseudomonas sp. B6002]NVZ51660.1 AraC family transcriptional regulator [Pseudomonas sp. B6002]